MVITGPSSVPSVGLLLLVRMEVLVRCEGGAVGAGVKVVVIVALLE